MSEENNEQKLLMNGVVIELKNPGTDGLADFLTLAKAMSGNKDDDFMKNMNKESIDAMVRLVKLTVEKTFGKDKVTDEVDAWAMENNMTILTKVIEMCSPKMSRDDKKRAELLAKAQN